MLRTTYLGQMSAPQPALWSRPSITALATAFAAVRDGLVTSRRYQRLRASGASHDAAIRDAFGIGPAASRPIHFAGRM
jgi:hypothetical protein